MSCHNNGFSCKKIAYLSLKKRSWSWGRTTRHINHSVRLDHVWAGLDPPVGRTVLWDDSESLDNGNQIISAENAYAENEVLIFLLSQNVYVSTNVYQLFTSFLGVTD